MVLTVIWLVTAAAALILTVVYLERLQKLYDRIDNESVQVQAAQNSSLTGNGRDPEGLNGSSAGDSQGYAVNSGQDDTGVTLAGEGGNPGGKEYSSIAENENASAGQNGGENGQAGSNGAAQTGDNETKANSASDAGNVTSGTNETTDNGSSGTIGTADNSGAGTEGTADNGGTGADGTANNGTSGTDATADNGSSDTGHGYEKYDYSLGLDPEKPIIALSFDDGPSSFTDRIVAALQANHVEATFFMVGYNISAFKDTVRLVYDAGMEIGNHTSNHKNLSKIKEKEIRSEVFDNEDLLNTIVPVGKIIVRPPYGALNSTVKSIVNRPMFNWSVDSLDWKTRDADSIVAQIQQDARDGYVILMHDLYESTAEAAERIIPWLIDHGYQLTTVSKLFKARGVETENGELYRMAQPAELR